MNVDEINKMDSEMTDRLKVIQNTIEESKRFSKEVDKLIKRIKDEKEF